jgi:predicted DCC family thiol-disulfide oxidoreductase YuxK
MRRVLHAGGTFLLVQAVRGHPPHRANPVSEIEPPVVLFDGVCNLCTASVAFILARDPERRFRFASLQSDAGRRLLERHGLPPDELATVVVVADGRALTRSDAALRIARGLGGAWPVLGVLRVVPRPLRDAVYGVVARNRYRWFGRRESCMLPTPELRSRFLDGSDWTPGTGAAYHSPDPDRER